MGIFEGYLDDTLEQAIQRDQYEENQRKQLDERATVEPEFDGFDQEYAMQRPKAEVGLYVASQGISVPIITTQKEWEQAFDDGTAMLRSELSQDYAGLSGLLSSERLSNSAMGQFAKDAPEGFYRDFGATIMKGLRSGELSGRDYMLMTRWNRVSEYVLGRALSFGGAVYLGNPTVSHWRFVEGTNVYGFADPHVEGRYYFGVVPYNEPHSAIGGYRVEPGQYDEPLHFRKHDDTFVARPFIEFYEQIRNLSRFDITQCPVVEMQQDLVGNMHFLQYLKTGKTKAYTDGFDLPKSDGTLSTTNVRGVTTPEGKDMRLYMAPKRLSRAMEGQGIFCSENQPRGIEVQFAAKAANFILHTAYISFKNNHFNASPLWHPPLAAGLEECYDSPQAVREILDQTLQEVLYGPLRFSQEVVHYVDIHVTSNGREATIESDWQPKTAAYEDIS
ncbi:MAG: hypothetical protein ACXWLH_01610 [Candidatus Saccharimonadales bacterium]